MQVNKKDTEKKDTRADRREKQLASETLNGLLKKYIEYKNRYFKEKNGEILLCPEVFVKFDSLNQQWRTFCHGYLTNPQRKWKFNVKAFSIEVDNHVAKHRELCWINFVLRHCKEILHCFPTIDNIRAKYIPDADPFTAALQIRQDIFNFIMNILEIPATSFKKEFAANINELTPDEYVRYIDLVLQLRTNMIDLKEFKTQLVLVLLNASSGKHFDKLVRMSAKSDDAKGIVQYINENVNLLIGNLDGFFEEKDNEKGEKEKHPIVQFTNNLQPVITVPFLKFFKRKLYGPSDALGNCTFFEFRRAHDYFIEYTSAQEDMTLAKLIATLYRPKKLFLFIRKHLPGYNGDIRQKITGKTNESYLLKRAEKINKLHVMYKFGVFQFFMNIEEFLRYGTIAVGDSQIELKVLYENDPDFVSTGPDIGLIGILFNIAEKGTLGPIEMVDNSNLYDVITLMYKSVKESNDNKATHDKMMSNVKS